MATSPVLALLSADISSALLQVLFFSQVHPTHAFVSFRESFPVQRQVVMEASRIAGFVLMFPDLVPGLGQLVAELAQAHRLDVDILLDIAHSSSCQSSRYRALSSCLCL
jgi:hypothetical protein